MIFNFKKSTITVDCFTHSRAAYELYTIRKAVRYYPETIKKMEPSIPIIDRESGITIQTPTLKKCTGLNGLYTKGAIIPLWMDFICEPKTHGQDKSRLGLTDQNKVHSLQTHSHDQFPGMFDNYYHMKFGGVWNIVENTGIKFIWTPAIWNLEEHDLNDKIIIPYGLTYYDEQPQTNLNIFVKKDAPNFILKAGTPMIHIIPLTEKEVEYKCHLVDFETWVTKNKIPPDLPMVYEGTRNARYRKEKAFQDNIDKEEKKAKCPFGFGR